MATNVFIGKKPISTSNSGSGTGNGSGLTSEQELKVNSLEINGNGDKALFDDGTYQDIATQNELDNLKTNIIDVESDISDLITDATILDTRVTNLDTKVTTLETDVTNLETDITTLETDAKDHIDNTDIHLSTADRNLLTSLNHNKGTFESEANLRATYPTANAGDYCICFNGTNYTMWTYSTDWVDTGVQGNVTSVNNLTGDITLDSTNVNYITGVTLKEKIDKKLENNNFVQGENIRIATDVNGDLKIDCDIIIEEVTEDDIDAWF